MTQSSTSSRSGTQQPLYIFTTSQTPLGARYPRPAKPTLIVPPLIHRSLHQALDQTPPSIGQSPSTNVSSDTASNVLGDRNGSKVKCEGITIPHPDQLRKHDIPSASEHEDVEVTLKIHLVGSGSAEERSQWVLDALALVDTHLGLGGADTLLVGFKGVDYKGKKTVETTTDSTEAQTNGSSSTANGNGNGDKIPASEYSVSPEIEKHITEFWASLSQKLNDNKATNGKKIKNLGTMYLPLGILRLLKQQDKDLAINSLDTPDCHHLPKDYSGWAREAGVQLWAGGGGEGSGQFPLFLFLTHPLSLSPPQLQTLYLSLSFFSLRILSFQD